MGVVYEAEQIALGRHVALKVLPGHALLEPRLLQRFQREARSAARLHHTNIVPVYGVGEHDGQHYYVMQFIHGLGLDTVLAELRWLRDPRRQPTTTVGEATPGPGRDLSAVQVARSMLTGQFNKLSPASPPAEGEAGSFAGEEAKLPALPTATPVSESAIHPPGQTESTSLSDSGRQYGQSVARVGAQVAGALDHAYHQGVLHRDIKPSNLLPDENGNVWITDFGLAKAVTDSDDLTLSGDLVGTLRYMAPERFSGKTDVRGDVYSLGLSLYEMPMLRPAFNENDRTRLIKAVMHDEPVRPRRLNPAVPRDLETVVLKAIAREPAHCYQTPAELAEDLERFVQDRPIRARRVSEAEKFWRWCRRNPALAAALAAALLLFWVAFAGITWNYYQAEAARKQEARLRRDAVEASEAAQKQEAAAKTEKERAERQEKAAQAARERAEVTLYYSNIARAQFEYQANNVADAEDTLDRCPPERRGWEWRFLKQLCHADLFTLRGHTSWVYAAAYSPDGKLLASAGGETRSGRTRDRPARNRGR